MLNKYLIISALLLISFILPAQVINVSGQYLDKKSNPLSDVKVNYYYHDGTPADSTFTGGDGFFELQAATFVVIGENTSLMPQKPFPNPFREQSHCVVHISSPARAVLSDSKGKYIDQMNFRQAGTYLLSWGGANRISRRVPDGMYYLNISGKDFRISEKLIKQGQGNGQGLKASLQSAQVINLKKTNALQDKLTFNHFQSSYLEMLINNPTQDTSLGVITGNAGPDSIAGIVTTVHIDSTNSWNLNTLFYNDDQSSYQTTNPDFVVQDDSLMVFAGSQTGTYVFEIIATDIFDTSLSDTSTAQITITDQQLITLDGTYLDQISDPIAGATVKYWEGGNTNIGQTTTGSNGDWELTISPEGKMPLQDVLEFIKSNTTTTELYFNTPVGDTTFGITTGNIGPDNTQTLQDSIDLPGSFTWDLNNYFHNDDQSEYTIDDEDHFSISNNILTFTGSEAGYYTPLITATDTTDNSLSATMTAQITVTKTFNLSGSYHDKISDPIINALVDYFDGGNTSLGQTNTDASGNWSLSITKESPDAQDVLEFSKLQTSTLELTFTTPATDTTFGNVIGNIGPEAISNINETHFTIDGLINWNLNNHFTNDDQNIYTCTGSDFYILQDTLLELSTQTEGNYNTTVTATDPQDAALTAQITADVEVEYTINIPDTSIIEDYENDTLFANLNQYINPNYQQEITYAIASQSNNTLIDLIVQDSTILINSLQADSAGSSYVGIEITGNNDIDTVYFTVTVNAMPDVSGYITDIFDTLNVGIADVVVEMTLDSITFYFDTTDANGYYTIQLSNITDTTYFRAILEKDDYTPFHSWATCYNNFDIIQNYTLVDTAFDWGLYNLIFRNNLPIRGKNHLPHHWMQSPSNYIYNCDTLVTPGYNIIDNVNTLIYNLKNITYPVNPRDIDTNKIYILDSTLIWGSFADSIFFTFYSWDNSIGGSGQCGTTQQYGSIYKGSITCKEYWHPTNPDNDVYNHEFGHLFGSNHPPQWYQPKHYPDVSHSSVFPSPTSLQTYSQADIDNLKLLRLRSKGHYYKGTFWVDPGYIYEDSFDNQDWEVRPDSVLYYYPESYDPNGPTEYTFKIYHLDGYSERLHFQPDKIPEALRKQFPMLF